MCAPSPIVASIPGVTPERERLMFEAIPTIRVHAPGPLVLVTRDAGLIREARAAGVDADEPEPFAAGTMTREAARALFAVRGTSRAGD
jgi:hypothetical protein